MATAYRLSDPNLFALAPPRPRSVEDLGLPKGLIRDLVLRTIFRGGSPTGMEISQTLHLPFTGVVEAVLDDVIRDKLVDFLGGGSFGRAYFEFLLTERGRIQAREAVERSAYVGPAPIPLDQYMALTGDQLKEAPRVSKADLKGAVSDLVLPDGLIDRLGPAVNSMRSLFLYGPPGNGKTAIAERMVSLLPGEIFVPHALCVEGQIIQVFDPIVHRPVESAEVDPLSDDFELDPEMETTLTKGFLPFTNAPPMDERWLLCHRPHIATGGELTLDALDLNWDPSSRVYQAPLQLKACKGILLIDDFGRQRVHPRDLLNRWIVPLEKGSDYLTLRTGSKFEVPFDLLTIFSTNIDPAQIVDAAFLRRIRYKIEISAPNFDTFKAIFEAEAARQGLAFDEATFNDLFYTFYTVPQREQRACEPRDILQLMIDISRFKNRAPLMEHTLAHQACQTYFVDMAAPLASLPPGSAGL